MTEELQNPEGLHFATFITDTLAAASRIAVADFGKVSGQIKPHDRLQVLTETDLKIGKMIIEKIQYSYPEYNIIDEEYGVIDRGSRFTWAVDPIDGTSNFAQGISLYCDMMGLLEDGRPIAGGIALPAFDEICVAERGKGAFCNGERIIVTDEGDLSKALVVYEIVENLGNPDATRKETALLAEIILKVLNVRIGGSFYDMVQVAKGKYGAYLLQNSKIWDNVANQVIIEEAGGVYTDFWGKPMDYSNPLSRANETFTCCAAAPALHKQLQEIIRRVYPDV